MSTEETPTSGDEPVKAGDNPDATWTGSRAKDLAQFPLGPSGLLGSYVHKLEGGSIVLQGQIVGEPEFTQPNYSTLLIEFYDWESGKPIYQRLVTAKEIYESLSGEWRFYDTLEAMRTAYELFERTGTPQEADRSESWQR